MKYRNAIWTAAYSAAVLSALGCGSLESADNSGLTSGGTGGMTVSGGAGGMMANSGAGGMSASGGAGGAGGAITSGGAGGMGGAAGIMASGGTGGGGAAGIMASGGMGGDGGMMGGMGGSGGSMSAGTCEPATEVDTLKGGPFMPTHIENGGASGSSWVFYPEDLGRNGMLHPIFNWGPGAFTGPSNYVDHLNHLASHGFVVISQPSSGSGDEEIDSLEWLVAENDDSSSPFYQKLDVSKVGAGGHSLGALTTMAMSSYEPLTLYVLVCGGCMSGNGGCGAVDIHAPTVILGGDTDSGTPNFEGDYEEITQPVVFVTKDSTDHIQCARNNLSPWTAFMRWQFCGEEQWREKFFDGGEYCSSPWECKSKNF